MKKSCKNIDITDVEQILPYVQECCYRHYRRYDFKNLFLSFGLDVNVYRVAYLTYNKTLLDETIYRIAQRCAKDIKAHKLDLPPCHIRTMFDSTTGKVRQIGKESALQQCFDYIAVYSCMEIFERRMVPHQASSIKKCGQVYGVRIIAKWAKTDNESANYAKRHGLHHTRKCKYHAKLDIRKCYPSANTDVFMTLLKHDCGNADIIWLWDALLVTHKVDGNTGFMIGALPSQWACQLMISYIYRHVMNLHYTRKGKKYKCVNHMMCFMDDMLLTASNRTQLKRAIISAIEYTVRELGWQVKPTWSIAELEDTSIDMMGFVVRQDGSIGIRARNFIHSRRVALKYHRQHSFTITQARRLLSYKGFYKYSSSRKVVQEYSLHKCFVVAANTVSRFDRRNLNGCNQGKLWRS